LNRIVERRPVRALETTTQTAVADDPVPRPSAPDPDGFHPAVTERRAVSGDLVDVTRPQTRGTMIAKRALTERLDPFTTDSTRERVVPCSEEVSPFHPTVRQGRPIDSQSSRRRRRMRPGSDIGRPRTRFRADSRSPASSGTEPVRSRERHERDPGAERRRQRVDIVDSTDGMLVDAAGTSPWR
jgi:hypothetical protein